MQIANGGSAGNGSLYFFKNENFNFQLEDGKVRYFSSGNEEWLRMIHLAVRDENWMTIRSQITELQVDSDEDLTRVSYKAEFVSGTVDFTADIYIEIHSTGMSFSFRGIANKRFLRNRIGICVLHPLTASKKNCVCNIERPDGSFYTGTFPEKISPEQPFKDIRVMKWTTPGEASLELAFEGDIFETEDQRNWGDASFKTYSTPLVYPFPVMIEAGTVIEQTVRFSFTAGIQKQKPSHLFRIEESTTRFPKFGFSLPDNVPVSATTISLLRKLYFDYLSLEITFINNWQLILSGGLELARQLQKVVQLVLTVKNTFSLPDIFFDLVKASGVNITSILILSYEDKIISEELLADHSQKLRLSFTGIPIGSGTRFHFAEINRHLFPSTKSDFISFPVNPQVHADDNATIIENLEVYPEITEAADKLYPSVQIQINRLTLRYPFNPDPRNTDRYKREDGLPWTVDERQWQMFYALWILPAIEKLSKAEQITICDTHGYNGLFSDFFIEGMPDSGNRFWLFPAYLIFLELGKFNPVMFYKSVSEIPFKVCGVCIQNSKGGKLIILSNFSSELQELNFLLPENFLSGWEEKKLSMENLKFSLESFESSAGNAYLPVPGKDMKTIRLSPFACHFYRSV